MFNMLFLIPYRISSPLISASKTWVVHGNRQAAIKVFVRGLGLTKQQQFFWMAELLVRRKGQGEDEDASLF